MLKATVKTERKGRMLSCWMGRKFIGRVYAHDAITAKGKPFEAIPVSFSDVDLHHDTEDDAIAALVSSNLSYAASEPVNA